MSELTTPDREQSGRMAKDGDSKAEEVSMVAPAPVHLAWHFGPCGENLAAPEGGQAPATTSDWDAVTCPGCREAMDDATPIDWKAEGGPLDEDLKRALLALEAAYADQANPVEAFYALTAALDQRFPGQAFFEHKGTLTRIQQRAWRLFSRGLGGGVLRNIAETGERRPFSTLLRLAELRCVGVHGSAGRAK